MTNKVRGEMEMSLDGQPARLRPSFDAIQKFEGQTGMGLIQLAQAAGNGSMTLGVAAIIVCACVREGASADDTGMKNANPGRVGQLIMEAPGGLLLALKKLEILLFQAATGGFDAAGEPKATGTGMATPAVA